MHFSLITTALLALIPTLTVGTPLHKRLTNQVIRSGRFNTCLSLQGGVQIVNGSPLVYRDCSVATRWDISPGSGSVIVTGTNFALDAGVPQANNNPGKVWQSYPGSPQQTWFLTGDNRIAVTGGNQCLDAGDNGPQTYQCTSGNTNQVWLVGGAPTGPTSSSSSSNPPPSSSSSSTPPPAATGKQLKWASNQSLCATVQSNQAGNGVLVNFQNCFNPTSPSGAPQLFNFMGNGLIQFAGSNYCLDAGTNPSNGVQCYVGLAQQTWSFPSGTGLYRTANNQCLDLDNSVFGRLQTWTCSAPDAQQQFLMV